MWGAFMRECAQLAERHPYVIKPKASQVLLTKLSFLQKLSSPDLTADSHTFAG